jgi:hypothetical protein
MATWPVMCKPGCWNPEWGHGIHHQGSYYLRTAFWLWGPGMIITLPSVCAARLSQNRAMFATAHRRQRVNSLLCVVPDWVALHLLNNKISTKHNIQKIYWSFITVLFLLHRPHMEIFSMLTRNILRASNKTFLVNSLCISEIRKREIHFCRSYDGPLWDTITTGIQR